ncbi:MAG TPA: hypothetical protein VE978_15480 [Chitinophagales bacterium]|nr:hypothetical protein [Chitinophagales bacterium]
MQFQNIFVTITLLIAEGTYTIAATKARFVTQNINNVVVGRNTTALNVAMVAL